MSCPFSGLPLESPKKEFTPKKIISREVTRDYIILTYEDGMSSFVDKPKAESFPMELKLWGECSKPKERKK